ncbi:MAG: hypothetical protein WCG16_10290 [Methylococcales bacterium]
MFYKNRCLKLSLIVTLIFSVNMAMAEAKVYVYKDGDYAENHGIWANIMPKEAAETGSIAFKPFFKPGYDGKGNAVKVVADVSKAPNWIGLVVSVKENYWGEKPAEGLNLSKAKKLVFYAKGNQGGEQIQVKAAIASDKQYGDSAELPITSVWLTLKKDWERFEIPINGIDLSRVITPFVLVINQDHNQEKPITFFVDEIYYEVAE